VPGENPYDVAALEADRQREAEREALARDTARTLRDGIAAVEAAREQARADIAVVDGLSAQATALSTQITNRIAAVSAFTPAATYSPAQLAAVRDELVWCLTQLRTLTDAQNGMYGWRRAVDRNAVLTDDSLIGLARIATRREGAD
jgi:hypothetical protein